MKRDTLLSRMVILTTMVALLVAVLAGLFAYPLIQATAEGQAKARLAALADVTASSLERGRRDGRVDPLPRRLAESLQAEDISGYLIFDADGTPPGVSANQAAAALNGADISATGDLADQAVFIEGRALADGTAVFLLQPRTAIGGIVGTVLSRFAVALGVGLIIAAVIGALAARKLAAPLREARYAANQIAAGDRDVSVEVSGPSEISDIGDALTHLSHTLALSENRQREFLLSVSHELRTPLTAIKGYGEAMHDGVITSDDVARVGGTVASEATRLERLVNDLLDLARAGAIDFHVTMVDTDISELLADVASVWADRCGRESVHFTLRISDHLPDLHTDPVRLRQVIDNLLENALRVSPTGTTITCQADHTHDEVRICVMDGGPGLNPDDVVDAFEPGVLYERYRGVRPVGTGLGLALVGRLAAGLGARVWAEASPDAGARFCIALPTPRLTVDE
jgi:signal transduction histidine kinase